MLICLLREVFSLQAQWKGDKKKLDPHNVLEYNEISTGHLVP